MQRVPVSGVVKLTRSQFADMMFAKQSTIVIGGYTLCVQGFTREDGSGRNFILHTLKHDDVRRDYFVKITD